MITFSEVYGTYKSEQTRLLNDAEEIVSEVFNDQSRWELKYKDNIFSVTVYAMYPIDVNKYINARHDKNFPSDLFVQWYKKQGWDWFEFHEDTNAFVLKAKYPKDE